MFRTPTWVVGAAVLVGSATALAQPGEKQLAKIDAAIPKEAPAKAAKARKVLIYSRTLGFRHGSIPTGAAAITRMGAKTGAYTAEHSEDPAMFDENRLKMFDAVLFLNTTGDCLSPAKGKVSDADKPVLEQRKKNLIDFVSSGKGFAGIHSATDTYYSWKEYGEMIGAYFTSHPWGAVPLKVDSKDHPLTGMFNQGGFEIRDEIYMFGPKTGAAKGYQPYARDKLRVLLSVDGAKFQAKGGTRPDSDYAISWIREYGKGRVFYCALGHGENMYMHPDVMRHYLAGLQYALGDLPADAAPSAGTKSAPPEKGGR